MKRERCVLFQWVVKDYDPAQPTDTGMFIEQLRYAGIVNIVKENHVDNETTYMLELKAPRGLTGDGVRVWAFQNANRMQSFGINAQDTWREL